MTDLDLDAIEAERQGEDWVEFYRRFGRDSDLPLYDEALRARGNERLLLDEVRRLRAYIAEEAAEGCKYGDNCPSFAGTRHGTCGPCRAREALK